MYFVAFNPAFVGEQWPPNWEFAEWHISTGTPAYTVDDTVLCGLPRGWRAVYEPDTSEVVKRGNFCYACLGRRVEYLFEHNITD
jgi:hypothetical protein